MNTAQKTYEVLKQFGVLDNIKKVSTIRNHDKNRWELWALFQNENGYRNGKIAEFDEVSDAVSFKNLVMFN